MVDIRYVLWVMDVYAGAGHLVEEMTLVQEVNGGSPNQEAIMPIATAMAKRKRAKTTGPPISFCWGSRWSW